MNEDGIPLTHRQGIEIASSFFHSEDVDFGGGSLSIEGRFHLVDKLFLDARIPLAIATGVVVGNIPIEVRGLVPFGRGKHFFIAGGGLAIPMVDDDTQEDEFALTGALSTAFWDLHEMSPWVFPLILRLGTEHHLGRIAILRTHVDPVISIPYGDNEEPELTVQTAVEAQIGQRVGGGLRLQAVLMPTWEDNDVDLGIRDDVAQVAIEPFFAIERDMMGGRIGFLLPIDELAGPPIERSWGFRVSMGARFD